MNLFKKEVEFIDWPEWQKKVNLLEDFYFKQMVRRQSLANSSFFKATKKAKSHRINDQQNAKINRPTTKAYYNLKTNTLIFYHPPKEGVFGSPLNPNPNYTIPTKNKDSGYINTCLASGVGNKPKIKSILVIFTNGLVKGYNYATFKKKFKILLRDRQTNPIS